MVAQPGRNLDRLQQMGYPGNGMAQGPNVPDGQLWQLGVGAATGDPSSVGTAFYQLIVNMQNQVKAIEALEKRIAERELEQRSAFNSRAVSVPFLYQPAEGVRRFSLGKVLKNRVNAISLITAPAGEPLSADKRDGLIFANFDYDIHIPQALGSSFPRAEYPPPDSFEIFLPVGGKLNQFAAVRDMDTLAIYSRQPILGTIFVTSGAPDVLPGL